MIRLIIVACLFFMVNESISQPKDDLIKSKDSKKKINLSIKFITQHIPKKGYAFWGLDLKKRKFRYGLGIDYDLKKFNNRISIGYDFFITIDKEEGIEQIRSSNYLTFKYNFYPKRFIDKIYLGTIIEGTIYHYLIDYYTSGDEQFDYFNISNGITFGIKKYFFKSKRFFIDIKYILQKSFFSYSRTNDVATRYPIVNGKVNVNETYTFKENEWINEKKYSYSETNTWKLRKAVSYINYTIGYTF